MRPSRCHGTSCPVNFVFTFAGLAALGLDPTTLASFPDAFTQGMAARADRLGDTGPSAPENWNGPLGVNDVNDLASVHGYFTGGFSSETTRRRCRTRCGGTVREGVAAFNARSDPKGAALRRVLNDRHFRLLGLKVVYIELGENPYEVNALGNLQRTPYRKEHFGFSDGVSQPFVDLGDPPRLRSVDRAEVGDLRIVLPRTAVELNEWATRLGNCLASFVPAVSQGACYVIGVEYLGRLTYCLRSARAAM